MKRIGYGKIARSMTFDPNKDGWQGDAEARNLLIRLARRNRDVTWVVAGKSTGGTLSEPNIENLWDAVDNRNTYGMKPRGEHDFFVPFTGTSNRYGATLSDGYYVSPELQKRDEAIVEAIGALDGFVIHAGNMGTTHISIPNSDVTWARAREKPELFTKPLMSSLTYGNCLSRGLNALGDRTDGRAPVVWVCPDPRNYVKDRSMKWPTGANAVLAQYAYSREGRHDRFEDPRKPNELGFDTWCRTDRYGEVWVAKHRYEHADLELMILPEDWETTWGLPGFDDRSPYGIATTSFNVGKPRRSQLVRDWVLPLAEHVDVYGKWDDVSLKDVPPNTVVQNNPRDFQSLLEGWRVTLALPVLGTGWTAAKPYQCFAANVACFYMGSLDDQGWTLPTRERKTGTKAVGDGLFSMREDWLPDEIELAKQMRVLFKTEFHKRAKQLAEDRDLWSWTITTQRNLLKRRWGAHSLEVIIEHRLGLR